jgi:hypothetical protein
MASASAPSAAAAAAATNSRLLDVGDEVLDNTNPIYGLDELPILALDAALKSSPLYRRLRPAITLAYQKADNRLGRCQEKYLGREEIAAVHIYTQDCPLYAELNRLLRAKERQALKPYLRYLKLFLTACYKLPEVGGNVWRGVPEALADISADHDGQVGIVSQCVLNNMHHYHVTTHVSWPTRFMVLVTVYSRH